jgi:hypothetical protein
MSSRPVFRALHRTDARLFSLTKDTAAASWRFASRSPSSPNSLIFQGTCYKPRYMSCRESCGSRESLPLLSSLLLLSLLLLLWAILTTCCCDSDVRTFNFPTQSLSDLKSARRLANLSAKTSQPARASTATTTRVVGTGAAMGVSALVMSSNTSSTSLSSSPPSSSALSASPSSCAGQISTSPSSTSSAYAMLNDSVSPTSPTLCAANRPPPPTSSSSSSSSSKHVGSDATLVPSFFNLTFDDPMLTCDASSPSTSSFATPFGSPCLKAAIDKHKSPYQSLLPSQGSSPKASIVSSKFKTTSPLLAPQHTVVTTSPASTTIVAPPPPPPPPSSSSSSSSSAISAPTAIPTSNFATSLAVTSGYKDLYVAPPAASGYKDLYVAPPAASGYKDLYTSSPRSSMSFATAPVVDTSTSTSTTALPLPRLAMATETLPAANALSHMSPMSIDKSLPAKSGRDWNEEYYQVLQSDPIHRGQRLHGLSREFMSFASAIGQVCCWLQSFVLLYAPCASLSYSLTEPRLPPA